MLLPPHVIWWLDRRPVYLTLSNSKPVKTLYYSTSLPVEAEEWIAVKLCWSKLSNTKQQIYSRCYHYKQSASEHALISLKACKVVFLLEQLPDPCRLPAYLDAIVAFITQNLPINTIQTYLAWHKSNLCTEISNCKLPVKTWWRVSNTLIISGNQYQ